MTDSAQVDLFFRYTVTDDDGFQQYLDNSVPITEKDEPWVLEYNIHRGADGVVFQHERYADEAAIHKHMALTAEWQELHAASTKYIDIRVVGPVSDEFKAALVDYNPTFWNRFRAVER
jgi:quinol monooxygenase YgiN